MSSEQLNVIALVSGGKDSFFSALHCQRNGHRLVALANLFPAAPVSAGSDAVARSAQGTTLIFKPRGNDYAMDGAAAIGHPQPEEGGEEEEEEAGKEADEDADLNSFMYQTVGHQIIPLYADATGLPLYRQPIYGGAKYEGKDYDSSHATGGDVANTGDADETESMVPLLRTIMAHHPEANALCAGAILSTYQRTRVESVALRLGLTPLAYLWKYPNLPPPVPGAVDDAQLLHDMAAAGLDARIIKVASAGLDEDFLWERVSSLSGAARVKRALRRFGAAEGSVLGEGGEFETLVLDGPPGLFRRAIEVSETERRVVREGGGTSWLSFSGASVREKYSSEAAGESCSPARVPHVLDAKFQALLESLPTDPPSKDVFHGGSFDGDGPVSASVASSSDIHWTVEAQVSLDQKLSVEEETEDVVRQIRVLLTNHAPPLRTTAIIHTVIVLRRMSDFPAINKIYGSLFRHPNPPSRVTISCGDLPQGKSIHIHVVVRPDLQPSGRNGLHVQGRSYWAPANIGPYSQAIDVPLSNGEAASNGARAVTIAGQIPLVPSSMILPTQTSGNLEMQIVLSLQHLWRIAIEMKVQLWTSAVAYFPKTPQKNDMQRQAYLASAAWEGAHAPGSDEDEDNEGGPDLWDRKYNPQYMSLGGNEDAGADLKLPDWSAVKGVPNGDEGPKPVPPFFAVEVEELPRAAGVEWHAHLGLARVPSSSVEYQTFDLGASAGVPFHRRVCHVVVAGVLVHTTIAWLAIEDNNNNNNNNKARLPASASEANEWMRRAYLKAIGSTEPASTSGFPYLVYVNRGSVEFPGSAGSCGIDKNKTTAFVHARSIWGGNGEEVKAVGVFK